MQSCAERLLLTRNEQVAERVAVVYRRVIESATT